MSGSEVRAGVAMVTGESWGGFFPESLVSTCWRRVNKQFVNVKVFKGSKITFIKGK